MAPHQICSIHAENNGGWIDTRPAPLFLLSDSVRISVTVTGAAANLSCGACTRAWPSGDSWAWLASARDTFMALVLNEALGVRRKEDPNRLELSSNSYDLNVTTFRQ